MHPNVRISFELPQEVRLAIADAVVLFGRIEQEVIEIFWVLADANLKARLKIARQPGTENFVAIIEAVERSQEGLNLDALKDTFRALANERNLIAHGAWTMADDKPWVVWHKFAEDTESVIGEHFEAWRFERFMTKGVHLLETLKRFHTMVEELTGTKTTAVPRDRL